ncbi:hypothetical protein pb186bvf_005634 [Paramecium bursaria]
MKIIKHDPRTETILQMFQLNLFPLLKQVKGFTFWICLFDYFYYMIMLIYQSIYIDWNPRPQQTTLYYFGQLYPGQMGWQFWRVIALEQHKNEVHLMISVGMKLHFLSFIEYNLGPLRTAIIYTISCTGGIIFQTVFTNDPGVCGSFHIGLMGLALYLQNQLITKCSAQQQIQFYFDWQTSQDFGLWMGKIVACFILFLLISIIDNGILINGVGIVIMISTPLGILLSQKSKTHINPYNIQMSSQ